MAIFRTAHECAGHLDIAVLLALVHFQTAANGLCDLAGNEQPGSGSAAVYGACSSCRDSPAQESQKEMVSCYADWEAPTS